MKSRITVCKTITELKELLRPLKRSGRSIGFVPTMGFFHAGHLSLIKASVKDCDYTVVSIFVNPSQFGPGEDFDAYPRDLETDLIKAESEGADCVFAPNEKEIYPHEPNTLVSVSGRLTNTLCGISRPHHFQGVCTVVTKLFNIVEPDRAFFGRKDAQQAIIIQNMVRDLNIPVEITVLPTVREEDGLAMSSRNTYLSAADRKKAIRLFEGLKMAAENFILNRGAISDIIADASMHIIQEPDIELDYFSIVDPWTLEDIHQTGTDAVIAGAIKLGEVRLIDNVMIRDSEVEL